MKKLGGMEGIMKFLPEDEKCLLVHLISQIGVVCLIMGPDFIVTGRGRWIYEAWPETWIIFPLIALAFNIFFVLMERSILGWICIAGSIFWAVYSKATFLQVLHILGK